MSRKKAQPQGTAATDPDDARDDRGRFGPNNRFGKGNSKAKSKAEQIRLAILAATSPSAIKRAIRKLVKKAEAGSRADLEVVLDRTIGKASPGDLLQRIERLEQIVADRERESL